MALRVLNPIVRPSARKQGNPTGEEKAEYAASLTRAGAVSEALTILETIDPTAVPTALLYESFALVTQWRYTETIPLLERYLASKGLSDYQRLVGQVNLAAAMVAERRHEDARPMLDALAEETRRLGLSLLHGNSLELSAQNAILAKRWRDAEAFLGRAEAALAKSGGLDELFVRKWRAVLSLLRDGGAIAVAALEYVRGEALARRHWETTRECDLFLAIGCRDEKLALALYFGTPYPAYRARIQVELGGRLQLPETYEWDLADPRWGQPSVQHRKTTQIDLLVRAGDKGNGFKAGQLLHRLLLFLSRDFYRPARVASIHAEVYPDEYFNPVSSPTRVHQIVKRLKQSLERAAVPIAIVEDQGTYRLRATTPCRLLLPGIAPKSRADALLDRLKARAGDREFSATEAAAWLSLSPRTTLRLLTAAVSSGACRRTGAASAVRYRF
jgi:hypothetical protein